MSKLLWNHALKWNHPPSCLTEIGDWKFVFWEPLPTKQSLICVNQKHSLVQKCYYFFTELMTGCIPSVSKTRVFWCPMAYLNPGEWTLVLRMSVRRLASLVKRTWLAWYHSYKYEDYIPQQSCFSKQDHLDWLAFKICQYAAQTFIDKL